MPGNFFDSNCLLYIVSADRAKANRARDILNAEGIISVQVLNEIVNVGRRKMKMSWTEIHTFIATIRNFVTIKPVTIETHDSGRQLAERYGFAVYDSFIVAAALAADCDTLWSEDMQDGMLVHGRLRIANPFRN